ncbi:OsmC family protein [Lonsdalea quercina]|uniref:OsmC family protein n=1 Tax=Lonsdalea quercina TaxID=71657 RepID=UPI003974E2D3
MAEKQHTYRINVRWTGNQGSGTDSYRGYSRSHEISAPGKAAAILGSSDPSFRGDAALWNPEELLLASLSACHKLWYLGLCAGAGVNVMEYEDAAEGVMLEEKSGAGQFLSVTLRPRLVVTAASNLQTAHALHHQAHEMCFIARSVNFEVRCEPVISSSVA